MGGKYLSYVRMKSPQQALEVEVWKEIFFFVHVFEEKFQSFCKNFGLWEFEGIEDFWGEVGGWRRTDEAIFTVSDQKRKKWLEGGISEQEGWLMALCVWFFLCEEGGGEGMSWRDKRASWVYLIFFC